MQPDQIEAIVQNRISELTPDGNYDLYKWFDGVTESATCRWVEYNKVLEIVFSDSTYIRISEAQIETNCKLYLHTGQTVLKEGQDQVIPCKALSIWTGSGTYNSEVSFVDFGNRLPGRLSEGYLEFRLDVRDGYVVSLISYEY